MNTVTHTTCFQLACVCGAAGARKASADPATVMTASGGDSGGTHQFAGQDA